MNLSVKIEHRLVVKMGAQSVEKRTLIVGAGINLIMALAGWLAYYLSGSHALLLDGNFSFITFLFTLVAISVSSIKSERTELFPFGQFAYESLYALLKGLMIIGMLLVAFTDNATKIFRFIGGETATLLNTEVIFVYSLSMTFLCFGLAVYYKYRSRQLNDSSTILRAEYAAAIIDGVISAGVGIALVGISYVNIDGYFGFLNYIGDSLLVMLLVVLLGKEPFVLVRDSFVEIAGGTLQNKAEKTNIEEILENSMPCDELLKDVYISKTGSNYFVVAYLDSKMLEKVGIEKILQTKEKVSATLRENYQNTVFEVVLA